MLEEDVKWFVSTCHHAKLVRPIIFICPRLFPTSPTHFRKVHIDTMLMPTVNSFAISSRLVVPCLFGPNGGFFGRKNEKTLGNFIFKDILCRWGGVAEIVTDNGPAFVAAAGYLSEKYGIITSDFSLQFPG